MMVSPVRNSLLRVVLPGLLLPAVAVWTAGLAGAQSDDPPARVARLAHLQGQVSIQPSGVDQWSQATSNYPVATGDRVYSDQDGQGEISAGDAVARVWHSTDVTMTSLTNQLMQLGLAQGTVRVHTFDVSQDNAVEIDTPNGAVTVTQPGDIRIDVYGTDQNYPDGIAIVTVNSGAIQLSGPNLQQDIGAGQSVRLVGTNPIQLADNAIPAADEFDNWSLDRDRQMRDSQTAQYVNRDAVGSDDLDNYGSWSNTVDYGPVWYPQQVAADWAPYREGHWVWTGPWGWTWVDDEAWGYAPFHYGRWVQVDDRWGWMPGPVAVRPIWSPALVAFVGGGGFSVGIGGGIGVSAWFPLGPGEPYRPWYHCSPAYQQRVNVTNINITVIHNTTIINNYNGYLRNPADTTRIDAIRYANRGVAVTAMRQTDFASARSVRTNMVHVDPQQLQSAQIMAHPMVRPTAQSVAPRPVSVPVSTQRPTLLTQSGRQTQPVPGARPQTVPYRAASPAGSNYPAQRTYPSQSTAPASPAYTQPNPQRPAYSQPAAPQAYPQRPLVNRNEAPEPRPSFQQQQPALEQDPGRPLEPQQLRNLNQGRPAGPSRDAEYPPHPAGKPSAAKPAPAPKDKDKDHK